MVTFYFLDLSFILPLKGERALTLYSALDDIYCIEPGYTTLNFH
jgi:hypothetical protein